MAKGDSIRTLSTAELLAEVRALDARRTSTSTDNTTQPTISSTSGSAPPNVARTLSTRFDNDNGNDYRNGFNGYGRGNNRGFRGRGGFGGRNGKKKSSDYNPDKYCRHCQRVGHDIRVCRKYAAEQEERKKDHVASSQSGSNPSSSKTGSEFLSDKFEVYLKRNSIQHSYTTPDHPQTCIRQ